MTQNEAKEYLAAYRDDLPLEELPEMQEALTMLESDEELQTWFEAEQQFDQSVRAAFEEIVVPSDLRDSILANAPSPEVSKKSKIVAFPTRRLWFAAAAAVVLTAAGLVKYFAFPPPVKFPGTEFASVEKFREDMAFYANSRFVLGHMTKDLTEAGTWLKEHQSPTYDATPAAIVEFEGMGCQTFEWGEHQISLVCFRNDDDDIVHLFVAGKDAFQELIPADELQSMQVRQRLATGGWMVEDKLYLLVGSKPGVKIDSILAAVSSA